MKFHEPLFSYGTLLQENIQIEVFNRLLIGTPDQLIGFTLSSIDFIENGLNNQYPIVVFTGNSNDFVSGMAYEISNQEIKKADEYETKAYTRKKIRLESGIKAWVYMSP